MLSSVIISIVYLPHTLFLPFLSDFDEIMDLRQRALIPPPNLYHFLKPVACEVGHSSIRAAVTCTQ